MDKIVDFLEGKPDELIEQIKSEMMEAAQKQKFEKAASLRDKLTNIEEILERQRISDPNRKDTDVFHYVVDQRKIYTNLFQIREGRIVGQENFIFSTGAEAAMEEGKESLDPSEIISTFIAEYYEKATNIPKEILIPDQVENQELLENWLSEKREKDGKAGRVKIIFPLLGEKNHLLELSLKNAASYAHQQKARWDKNENDEKENLEKLAEILKLKKAPKRMECYDISHVGGTDTVASMVVFTNGLADNGQYRRFRLKTIPDGKPDDYASMEEVLTRRLKYIKSKRFQYKFATKKALKEIQEKDDQATDPKNIFCIFEKEKLIGFIRLVDKKEIQNLWIHPDYRGEKLGHELILQLMEKQKEKKYYVTPEGSLTEYYENFGFQESKEDPSKMLIETAKTLAQHKKFAVKPDVMVIDGGKGQLAVAEKVMKKLQLDIPLCSLAKQEEEIFVPGEKTSILLPRDSKVLHLFQRIRDEAHRFAITYSTTSHRKGMFTSALDEIEGIGDLSRKKLLNAFGTIENIKMAPLDQLARVIGKKAAIKVKQELQKGK
jgi:excinuclease ABC subunit C